ncbi:hypothetical protein [Amycolatopsis benzoatilytica]|uniref:hypothetical protein n=1 Tax=Amycolatopsis benzoatilytica TaxID=346045 RepID=UPI000370282A|nr:hypothetical protein [Amycolatopsis benzoatilytica]
MGNPESGSDLESVANLVRLSETAPMPRIDGTEPPPLVRPRVQRAEATSSAFGGVLDGSTGSAAEQLAARGPAPAVEATAPPRETAPPVTRRPMRYSVVAGAAVVLCAGLGAWALWPSPGGSDGQPVVPPAPTRQSEAPPAVSTLSASPAPPAITGQVRDTSVRPTSRPAPRRTQPTQGPPDGANQPPGPGGDSFGAAVSSYLQQWSEAGYPVPEHWRG